MLCECGGRGGTLRGTTEKMVLSAVSLAHTLLSKGKTYLSLFILVPYIPSRGERERKK